MLPYRMAFSKSLDAVMLRAFFARSISKAVQETLRTPRTRPQGDTFSVFPDFEEAIILIDSIIPDMKYLGYNSVLEF